VNDIGSLTARASCRGGRNGKRGLPQSLAGELLSLPVRFPCSKPVCHLLMCINTSVPLIERHSQCGVMLLRCTCAHVRHLSTLSVLAVSWVVGTAARPLFLC